METLDMIDEKIKILRYCNQEHFEGINQGHVDVIPTIEKIQCNQQFIDELIISKRIIIKNIYEYRRQ